MNEKTNSMIFFIFLSIFFSIAKVSNIKSSDFYRAGIANLKDRKGDTAIYTRLIDEAKKENVELILFPELSLIDAPEIITDGSNPCKSSDDRIPIQKNISCAAKKTNIYVVFDMVERGENCDIETSPDCYFGYYAYNTLVVLDRSGDIIAKYRKGHIMDFHIIAEAANCLINKYSYDSSGSGIFHKGECLVKTQEKEDLLLVANVPIIKKSANVPIKELKEDVLSGIKGDTFVIENRTMTFQSLPGLEGKIDMSLKSTVCNIVYKISDSSVKQEYFMLVSENYIFRDIIKMSLCGIISCGESLDNCDNPTFTNTRTETFFSKIDVHFETKYNLRTLVPLTGTDEKDIFKEGIFEYIKEVEKSYTIKNVAPIDQPVLFVATLAVINDD